MDSADGQRSIYLLRIYCKVIACASVNLDEMPTVQLWLVA